MSGRNATRHGLLRAGCLTLVVLLGATGCEKKSAAPSSPPEVLVVTVTPKDVPIYVEWIGTLEGYVNADIRAQVTGYLLTQNYAEGSEVKKGDLMFQIDPRPFQATLDQSKGVLAQAEARFVETELDVKRYEPLAKVDAISQQAYTSAVQSNVVAQAAIKTAQAAVETAQVNLDFTKITSPIDGLAGIAQAQIGDLVGPTSSNPLTTVSTIDPIKVYFPVSEQAYLDYRRRYTNVVERTTHERELELQLIFADGSVYPLPGKFFFVGRQVDVNTGTIQVVGLFPNPTYILRPGQYALVRAKTQIRKDALVVPQRAVSQLQTSYQVDTVDQENKAHIIQVTVGEQVGSDWIIEKGLKPGDRVIVEGIQKVKEGTTVKPEPFVRQKQTNNPASSKPGNQ
jgi:membrane fusion protein, multidrug efflux system